MVSNKRIGRYRSQSATSLSNYFDFAPPKE
jgi:hypothetical protein